MRILYDSFQNEYKRPFGTVKEDETSRFRIMIPKSVPTVRVELCILDENEAPFLSVPMARDEAAKCGGDYHCFSCSLLLEPGLYFYFFRIQKTDSSFRLFRAGHDTNMEAGDLWQLSIIPKDNYVPEWARGAVYYQIFPDRFCKLGDTDITEKLAPFSVHSEWNELPEWRPDENGEITNSDFFGGNIPGIVSKLGYLKEMGVQVLYLNPIFQAWSNHRYDTADYRKIDPMLGTERDFTMLCDMAHRMGIRIVLDGVFSHIGNRSEIFRDAKENAKSEYRNWFFFTDWPEHYRCWWDFATLPYLNKDCPQCKDYLIGPGDSVVAHWLMEGADGWRLDVVDELPDCFVRELKNRVREEKHDALVIGEVWEDASNKISYDTRRHYFVDDQLDAVMNYPLQKAILAFVMGRDDGTALNSVMEQLLENYPEEVLQASLILLSSHDTIRALTFISGSGEGTREERAAYSIPSDRLKDVTERFKQAVFLQFMLPGSPMIFYGDEAGMQGGRDPFCRGTFPWDYPNKELQEYHAALARLHNGYPEFRTGSYCSVTYGKGIFSFQRGDICAICNLSGNDFCREEKEISLLFGTNIDLSGDRLRVHSPGNAAFMTGNKNTQEH